MNYKISKIFKVNIKYRSDLNEVGSLNDKLYDEIFILLYSRIVGQLERQLRDQILCYKIN